MQGEDLTTMMVVVMDETMQERENTISLDRVIGTIIRMTSQFNEKDISRYLEAYKVRMLMWDIPEAKKVSGFGECNVESPWGDT